MTSELKYDISVCVDTQDLACEAYEPAGWPGGLRAQVLRRLESDGSIRAAVIDIPAGWSSATPSAGQADEQAYLLRGDLQVGGNRFTAGAFTFYPAGGARGTVSTEAGARLIAILGGAQSYAPAEAGGVPVGAVEHADAMAVPAFEPEIDGRKTGTNRRVLWEDLATGADTRLLQVGAGFEGRGANWHPVHEEIYCLAGDIGPDDTRLMKPGYYLHNPAYGIHGFHEHSVGGATILEWHDGKWSFNLCDESEGDKA